MDPLDLAILVPHARAERLVIFAGAGVSMSAPSSLPGWKDLNTMILAAVASRVRAYFDGRPEIEQLLQSLIDRRDTDGTFAPDYQAQIMEEQCGITYFRALQALDIELTNASHRAIASLATTGSVAAIVTTNFDRLLEHALETLGVRFRVYATTDQYRMLAASLTGDTTEIPIIKVHGTVTNAESMVDTLKQRRRGRGPALNEALATLLRQHYWLYLGFSASDLEYDPDYLGLRAAGPVSPGFMFVHQRDRAPREGAVALQAAYGEKGRFVAGLLDEVFDALLPALGVSVSPSQEVAGDGLAQVADGVTAWAAALHPMDAINLLAALLEAAGQEEASLWVLHRTWRAYRMPNDTSGEAYSRYLFNYGRLALLHGQTDYEETPQNFFRSHDQVPEAALWAGLYFLYAGMIEYAIGTLNEAFEAGHDDLPAPFVVDRALIYSSFADLYGESKKATQALPYAYQRSLADGDEPRRGRVLAATALHLARTGDVSKAAECATMGAAVAKRLGDDVLGAELDLVRGVVYYMTNDLNAAWTALAQATAVLSAQQRIPLLAAATLEWTKVAFELGRYDEVSALLESAHSLTRTLPVYDPHFYWLLGRLQTLSGHHDEARDAIASGQDAATRLKNQWMIERLDTAAQQLEQATKSSSASS